MNIATTFTTNLPVFISFVTEALQHPCTRGYGGRILEALSDMEALQDLAQSIDLSAANTHASRRGTWLLPLWSRSTGCLQACRRFQPFFFIKTELGVVHVHILDIGLNKCRSALLAILPKKPSQVEFIIKEIITYLDFDCNSMKWQHAAPFEVTTDGPVNELFRADGRTGFIYVDSTRSAYVRSSLYNQPQATTVLRKQAVQTVDRQRLIIF